MLNDNSQIIDLMRTSGMGIGDLVSVTLSPDAVWDDGYTPAPTVDPQGYRPFEKAYDDQDCQRRTGLVVGGFVYDIVGSRVYLCAIRKDPACVPLPESPEDKALWRGLRDKGVFYVHNDAIFDFSGPAIKRTWHERLAPVRKSFIEANKVYDENLRFRIKNGLPIDLPFPSSWPS